MLETRIIAQNVPLDVTNQKLDPFNKMQFLLVCPRYGQERALLAPFKRLCTQDMPRLYEICVHRKYPDSRKAVYTEMFPPLGLVRTRFDSAFR